MSPGKQRAEGAWTEISLADFADPADI